MAEHSIGKTIAELRKVKGWTQVELAERLNVSDKTISKWESEAGYPEFTMLPQLANIFDVSLDYLMTGKKAEPKIILMSKAELCAKTDDISLLNDINYTQTDENNKCLIDYIKQYESLNVFAAVCTADKKALSSFDILTALKFCLLSNHVELLKNVGFWLERKLVTYRFDSPEEIMGLMPIGALEHFGKSHGKDKYVCILPDEFFTMIVTDTRINDKTIDFLLGHQHGRKCVWYHAYPYMIDACYDTGNSELLERLLTLSEENNQYAYDNLKDRNNYAYNYFFIGFIGRKDGHGLVRILDKTLKSALQKNDFVMIERMNRLNRAVMKYYGGFKCGVVSDDEIRIAKLKLDKSVSAQDIIIQSSIHNGIVIIDELLAVNDADCIFSGLVHSHEGLTWHEPKSGVVTIKTMDQLAEYLLLCKKQVVDDFKANHNADKIIEELSEEYFRKELDKGNIELVAIKLCVRLETVLKSKYHYEGDFSEMLEKYCSQYGVYEEDDGWGYIETRTHEFVTYLQKLRKYRNSIVHSEKKVDGMTKEELDFCIKYICEMK